MLDLLGRLELFLVDPVDLVLRYFFHAHLTRLGKVVEGTLYHTLRHLRSQVREKGEGEGGG